MVVYLLNEVLFTSKNEWNSDLCYNMDISQKGYVTEIGQIKMPLIVLFNLHEVSRKEKQIYWHRKPINIYLVLGPGQKLPTNEIEENLSMMKNF